MRPRCETCGKTSMSGHNVSHSKRRTKTRFMPNIQSVLVPVDGKAVRKKLCTRCLRNLYRPARV